MAKEQVAFELENPNGFVTQASQIGMNGRTVAQQITGRDDKINGNSSSIESKVNALISVVQTLVPCLVFHSGVPYGIPQQLLSHLGLLRIGNSSSTTTAICGQAICGQAICGNS